MINNSTKISLEEILLKINNDWVDKLIDEKDKPYFGLLDNKIQSEYDRCNVYPSKDKIFNSLESTSFDNTKVVIIGQD